MAGAGPSQTTFDLPRPSLPVTTRRIGFNPPCAIASLLLETYLLLIHHPYLVTIVLSLLENPVIPE
jgi:hypothetical protein